MNCTSHISERQLDCFIFLLLGNTLDLSKSKSFSNRAGHSLPCLNSVRIFHAFMMKSIWLLFVPEHFYYFAQVGECTTFIENRCQLLSLVSIDGQLPWKYRSADRFRSFTFDLLTKNWLTLGYNIVNRLQKSLWPVHGMNTIISYALLFLKKRSIKGHSTALWI